MVQFKKKFYYLQLMKKLQAFVLILEKKLYIKSNLFLNFVCRVEVPLNVIFNDFVKKTKR